jgi:cytosine/adenosine deaminase-related metal-dependent hydrolase
MFMAPLRDPIKNIVYNATPEDLQEVMIDGAWVVRGGKVLNFDEREVSAMLQHAGERMWAEMGAGDWARRGVDELSPPLLKPFEG